MPRPRLDSAAWWPELLTLKDDLSLSEMSERYGVSINGLSRALKRAGVKRKTVRRGRGPAKKPVAAPKGADARSAEAQDWWDDFLALKDQKPLADLAKRFGVAEITLQRAMKRTGTQRRSQRGARGSAQARKAARRLKPIIDTLGTVPDAVVAEQTGLTRYAVAQYRRRNGIPSVRDPSATPAPPPAPAAKATPAVRAPKATAAVASTRAPAAPAPRRAAPSRSDAEAYLVRVSVDHGSVKYVVVGRDLADAASQAQASITKRYGSSGSDWTIQGMEFLGLAL